MAVRAKLIETGWTDEARQAALVARMHKYAPQQNVAGGLIRDGKHILKIRDNGSWEHKTVSQHGVVWKTDDSRMGRNSAELNTYLSNIHGKTSEAATGSTGAALLRSGGQEPIPINAFRDDIQRKLQLRKMMGQGKRQVQAEAIETDDMEEIGAPGSGMGGADSSMGSTGSTTLPGGDEESSEAEGFFDDEECSDEVKDADGNCPGDPFYDEETAGWNASEKEKEVSPPGWSDTVKAMKKHKDIDNPFALAWSMKNKGDSPHYPPEKKKEAQVKEAWSDAARAASAMARKKGYTVKPTATGTFGNGKVMVHPEGHELFIGQKGDWEHFPAGGGHTFGRNPSNLGAHLDELHGNRLQTESLKPVRATLVESGEISPELFQQMCIREATKLTEEWSDAARAASAASRKAKLNSFSKDRYQMSNGQRPKGFGNWLFNPNQNASADHPDTFMHRGSFGDAVKAASEHYGAKGHSEFHVLP